jgi:ferredoxin
MTILSVTVLPANLAFAALPQASVLAAAEAAGVDLPSSCRNGTCRTCICRLDSGVVSYLVAWPGLSSDEKREGWMLPCVAVAQSDLRITAPAARRVAPP